MDYFFNKILDIWAEHTDGAYTEEEDGTIFLDTWEETHVYNSKEEAVDDCLYTISQWLKEA